MYLVCFIFVDTAFYFVGQYWWWCIYSTDGKMCFSKTVHDLQQTDGNIKN